MAKAVRSARLARLAGDTPFLSDNTKRLATRGIQLASSIEDTVDLLRGVKIWWKDNRSWWVSVPASDRLFDAALRWFMSGDVDTEPPRDVKAQLAGRSRQMYDDSDDNRRANPVNVFYNEASTRDLTYDGHRITVSLVRTSRSASPDESMLRSMMPDSLSFRAMSQEGQQAILRLLNRIALDATKRKPALHMMTTWDDWQRRDDLPERPLDSVILKAGQMERIADDLQRFLDAEPDYARRGIPYHRGYLLYGPPGTGKTSIVRALAAHFGLDLWYAPLGDLKKDSNLLNLINQVKPGSILLLEDIDIFHASTSREETTGLSMAGLLNALDGVATPHGLITFMTTNDQSVIDEAVIRPGRVDLREEVGMPQHEQVVRLYESWYSTTLTPAEAASIRFVGSAAEITELFKRHLNDPVGGLAALRQASGAAENRAVTVSPLVRRTQ